MEIKDSGARSEFASGAVRDIQDGKGRCDLLPLDVVSNMISHGGGSAFVSCVGAFTDNGNFGHLYHAIDAFIQMCGWDMPTAILEVSIHFEEGAKKYAPNNWKKGIPVERYVDSAMRHFLKWLRGDDDEPHDRAVIWNLMCAIWTCKHMPELNEYDKF